MENSRAPARTHGEACARVAALFRQHWLRYYAAGKLRRDPVFRMAYDSLGESAEPLLDVGCGVGLLGFYLWERGARPNIIGVDRDQWKLQQGRQAAGGRYDHVHFQERDARVELPAFRGNVALIDVLHYVDPPRQQALLEQLTARVAPGGMLLLRDCPRNNSLRFLATYLGELFAQAIKWNVGVPLHFPTRDSIVGKFSTREFMIEEKPAWGGGPLNNWLYIFRRKADVPVGDSCSATNARK